MRRPVDPTRRNRNIGTSKQGHGSDNRFDIPESWHSDRLFYERVESPIVVHRVVSERPLPILVEPPRSDCFHPCTVDDVMRIVELLPKEACSQINTIVLRQPKRKEQIFASCWGRLVYWAQLGRYGGMAIHLEAQPRSLSFRWTVSQGPFGLAELQKLRTEGHVVKRTPRHFEVQSSAEACRTTQLFRTLPHELGHLVHYIEALEAGLDHWSRPTLEREQFAETYASNFRELAADSIPFPSKVDLGRMSQEGLKAEWFSA